MTRRVVDPVFQKGVSVMTTIPHKYGKPGDRLWVRETTIIAPKQWNDGYDFTHLDSDGDKRIVQYLATHPNRDAANDYKLKAIPSIFMPRWACRILLEITEVRGQRLQDISEEDALAEGVSVKVDAAIAAQVAKDTPARMEFWHLWESINSKRGFGWDSNPWVWCLAFKKLDQIDTQRPLAQEPGNTHKIHDS